MIYKGLFFLLLGLSSYTVLLLLLRLISTTKKESSLVPEKSCDWHSKESLEIVDIILECHDVKTFRLKRSNGKPFSVFSPGQFLSFQIKNDTKLLRSYSISGSCENRSTLQVTVKKIKDGIGSGWFHSLNAGDRVWAYPPQGLFTDDHLEAGSPRVYIGAGIGITPLISMIKTAIDRSSKVPMTLFYGVRSTNDLAFHGELELLNGKYDNFSYFPLLSGNDDTWSGDRGRVSYDYIKSKISIDSHYNFYFCGPPALTESISELILSDGHDEKLIHSEKFASPVSFDLANIPERSATVLVKNQNLSYQGKASILEFLEENDLEISFACRSGVCGACKCKLINGEVDAFTDSGLTEAEKRKGYILSCVSRPTSDIKIEIDDE